ncbi:MAG: hypothetical protein PHN88_11685 [Ignavibacteria bacterium]|nr:hypothetical protein [Ignavibacteria bacterium]
MNKSFLFILILVTGTAFCQNYSLKNIKSTDTENNFTENIKSEKFFNEVSVFGNLGFASLLGRLKGEGMSSGNGGINFGIQTRFLRNYTFFISREYVKYGYAKHPAADHWFIIGNYNAGIKYEITIENNQKINFGLGLGPYFYEKDKDDNGNWVVNQDETCFGGSFGINAEISLFDFYSLGFGSAIHTFHSSNKGWLSYIMMNIGMRFGYKL